eukprot:gene17371-33672_t
MSRKKAILQVELNTQEEWESFMAEDGLKVVDAYTAWCGPCTALVSHFKKLKNDYGDPLLKFATIKTDGIEALSAYFGKSQPTILFYGKDVLVNVIRGANSPLITTVLKKELEAEHNVNDTEGAERVPYVDEGLNEAAPKEAEKAAAEPEAADAEPEQKERAAVDNFAFCIYHGVPGAGEEEGADKPAEDGEEEPSDPKLDAFHVAIAEAGFKVVTQGPLMLADEHVDAGLVEKCSWAAPDTEAKNEGFVLKKDDGGAMAAFKALDCATDDNGVHCSDNQDLVTKQILAFFPEWAAEANYTDGSEEAAGEQEKAAEEGGDEAAAAAADGEGGEAEDVRISSAAKAAAEKINLGSRPATAKEDAEGEAAAEGQVAAPAAEGDAAAEGEAAVEPAAEGEATTEPATEGEVAAEPATEGEAAAPAAEGDAAAPAADEGNAAAPAAGEAAAEPAAEEAAAPAAEEAAPAAEEAAPAAEEAAPAAEEAAPAAEEAAAEPAAEEAAAPAAEEAAPAE